MGSKRKNHSEAFKAKVALEAAKGMLTGSELSSKYGIHQSMIAKWKKHLLDHAQDLFAPGKLSCVSSDSEALAAPLYQEIGRLKMEVDFLQKKC